MAPRILALDLEGTLISDAMTATPRPGLFDFLTFCLGRFEKIVLFTCVEALAALEILGDLSQAGHVPQAFLDQLECVEWEGEYKDLRCIAHGKPEEVLLVDDDPTWVRSDQQGQFLGITAWDSGEDSELVRMQSLLEERLGASSRMPSNPNSILFRRGDRVRIKMPGCVFDGDEGVVARNPARTGLLPVTLVIFGREVQIDLEKQFLEHLP